jgi:hypothetical protein
MGWVTVSSTVDYIQASLSSFYRMHRGVGAKG